MTLHTLRRWIAEVPRIVTVLSFAHGVVPLAAVRFGGRPSARVQVRGLGHLTLVNRLSAMVFLNIWVRDEYPRPRDQEVVLDLGANVGMFTTFALSHGACFAHCVEPCPASVEHLKAHIANFGLSARTNVIAKAEGASAGTGYVPATSNVSNVVSPVENAGLVQVEVADVAALLESVRPAPTYVKFDIESNEVPVLRRLLSSPAMASVHTIAVESITEGDTIAAMLQKAGFTTETSALHASVVRGFRARVPTAPAPAPPPP